MKPHDLRLFCTFLVMLGLVPSVASGAEGADREGLEFFEKRIRPVLVQECYQCHSAEKKQAKGGLRLDTRAAMLAGGDSGPALVPGKPGESVILNALRYEDLQMPPKKKLPESVVSDFGQWIGMGAPDPRTDSAEVKPTHAQPDKSADFWAFKAPQKTALPAVRQTSWPKNAIDRFILAGLEAKGMKPSPPAEKRVLIRRLYFDMIGLPPEPEAVEAFVADNSANACEKVVDGLLASPHYGERWGRYWLDVARYAEDQAHTFSARMYPRGYLYRDWVVGALNDDMPYDQFLKFQVAGDLLSTEEAYKNRAALGLFALGPVYYQDNGEKDKAMADEWDDRVDVLMRGTQGLTLACARCHDHKYDPLTMKDYYGLTGVFASSDYVERPAVPESVVEARRQADLAVAEQQLAVDRFLAEQAPAARLQLVGKIPDYFQAAWKLMQSGSDANQLKMQTEKAARTGGLDTELLARWVAWLKEDAGSGATRAGRPYFESIRRLKKAGAGQARADDLKQAAADLENEVRRQMVRRNELRKQFGENLAFVSEGDRSEVVPGVIPLGNLFDDKKGVSLKTALASDTFKAVATDQSLGVARVAQGWGKGALLSKGVRFDVSRLGSNKLKHGEIVNDAWSAEGGIQTRGVKCNPAQGRTEQGIGMHANAMITFDLDEIRKAGLIPANETLRFQVDRAGINDDSLGAGSVHISVILSRPNSAPAKFDAIIAAYLNGQRMKTGQNDQVFQFEGELPKPLRANGQFAAFDVPVEPEAKYLSIVVTAAEISETENTISSDHAVLSGVRLSYQPSAQELAAVQEKKKGESVSADELARLKSAAYLISEMFDDQGLLGLPAGRIDSLLKGPAAEKLVKIRDELSQRKKYADAIAVPLAHSLAEGNGRNLKVYMAGDPKKQGDEAPRSFPAVLTGGRRQPFESKGSGRLELARAIASETNPLTARVIVNRIWAGHFGVGLVRTLNNFGQLGERPSHPELLDYLAVELMKGGWSLKRLHREILLSATYQQASSGDSANQEQDPANRMLWRMNRRRLEIEPWRDSVLAVSGQLDRKLGGPSAPLSTTNTRRTFYGTVSRHQLNDLLRLFDFPDPNITAGERSVTTVPLQQLFVMNSDFMVNQAKALAKRLKGGAGTDHDRILTLFRLMYGRTPTADEQQLAEAFLKTTQPGDGLDALEQFCLAMLGTNEFTYVD